MNKLFFRAVLVGLFGFVGAASVAQADTSVHAGISIAAVSPAGLSLREVEAPARFGMPVRLVYENSQHEVACVIDVLVAANAGLASEALDRWRLGIVQQPPRIAGLGDRGYGAANVYGFVSGNIMYALRSVDSAIQAERTARQALAAIERAPSGATQAAAARSEPNAGTLTIGAGPRALRVMGDGPVVARATPNGNVWRLVRTREGSARVRILAVDEHLRQSETVVRVSW